MYGSGRVQSINLSAGGGEEMSLIAPRSVLTHSNGSRSEPRLSTPLLRHQNLFRFFGRVDHSAHIEAARGADDMRRCDRAALGADGHILGLEPVMCAAFSSSAVGMLAFGDCHDRTQRFGSVGEP